MAHVKCNSNQLVQGGGTFHFSPHWTLHSQIIQLLMYGSCMFIYHIVIFWVSFALFLQLLPKPVNSLAITLVAAREGLVLQAKGF